MHRKDRLKLVKSDWEMSHVHLKKIIENPRKTVMSALGS